MFSFSFFNYLEITLVFNPHLIFRLQISDGVMKLQTPKKRRKLYSGKKDTFEDFNDYEDENNGIQSSIDGILSILEDDKAGYKKNE